MRYKLINQITGEEHLCDKVTIDGFDYYVSDEKATEGFYGYINFQGGNIKKVGKYFADDWKKVIATNNPNIDILKVVDEVERLKFVYNEGGNKDVFTNGVLTGIEIGYNKSQETHPFSEEDMIEFAEWKDFNFYQHIQDNLYKTMQARPMYKVLENKSYILKELLQIWKEQRIKTLYYE